MNRRRWIPLALLLGAAGLGLDAGWLHAKAWLAQQLLNDAWQAAIKDAKQQPPWPWADTYPVARLSVPGLDVEQIVLAGDNGRVMAFGPGWAPSSAAPGSAKGSVVISGHRHTHFAWLAELAPGDLIELESAEHGQSRRQLYWISDLRVADSQRERLLIDDTQARLVLVTCWPFNAIRSGGTLRYVVTAIPLQRTGPLPAKQETVEPKAQDLPTRFSSARMREMTSA